MKHYRITLQCWDSNPTTLQVGRSSSAIHMHNSGITLYSKFLDDEKAKEEGREMWKRHSGVMREITIMDGYGNEVVKRNNFAKYDPTLPTR